MEEKKDDEKHDQVKKEKHQEGVEKHGDSLKEETSHKEETHKVHHKHKEEKLLTGSVVALIVLVAAFAVFNQLQINGLSEMAGNFQTSTAATGVSSLVGGSSGVKDILNVNIAELKSTGHTIAAVFPVENIQTADDAMAILFPTGTPDYGAELEVSYDDPVGSLSILARMYRGLKTEVQTNNPEGWQRYMNLASKPVGISCEYCCGIGPVGINKQGDSACGCQHNPALLTVALYLSAYTDYSDGEILLEVMKWKTLFFPKKMIELGMTVAGGDTSSLENLPGMVGGC